jgi:hypothetical protein
MSQNLHSWKQIVMRQYIRIVLFIGALLALQVGISAQGQPQSGGDFNPETFKAPPAKYRGHAMWNFNLTTLNEHDVIAGIQEMAKLNYGGFFIEAGSGPSTGLSEAYPKRSAGED